MWDEKSIHPRIETVYAFTEDMNDELFEKLSSDKFDQVGVLLKREHYTPRFLIVHHHLLEQKMIKVEIIRMGVSCFLDTVTSLDIREIVKIGG